ncbi:YbhB/YbcL family Raf kinase inhibitor-like protein [Mycobacterium sp.]|uniref:YbhB/YbcL family Raf kinase inhibitor-like protein n=1 Tax=Mycobacterium sp. TaxID=1785 RepID=UPI0031D6225B
MRRAIVAVALLIPLLPGCGGAPGGAASSAPASSSPVAPGFAVNSPAFADNTQIPVEYSCEGRNVPPPLRWRNPPAGTASLALVVDDPDAPAGRYVHWVVTGIPPSANEIGDGPLPQGARVSLNSGGKAAYFGPCPPAGTGVHHYRFQLSALSTPLTLAWSTPAGDATQAIADVTRAQVGTVGLFGR